MQHPNLCRSFLQATFLPKQPSQTPMCCKRPKATAGHLITGPRLRMAGHQAPQGRPCPPRTQGSHHIGVGQGRVKGPICPQAEWWLWCGSSVGSFGARWVRSENNSCGNKCYVQPACLPNFRETIFLLESWSRHAASRHLSPRRRPWPHILSPRAGVALGTSLQPAFSLPQKSAGQLAKVGSAARQRWDRSWQWVDRSPDHVNSPHTKGVFSRSH